jgi:hypothetical protein
VTAGNGTVEFDICHDVNGRLDHFTAPWFCVSLEGSQPAPRSRSHSPFQPTFVPEGAPIHELGWLEV